MDKSACSFFKSVCDETRRQILSLLRIREYSGMELLEVIDVSQSTLSHHMKILVENNVVIERKEGKFSKYSLNTPEFLRISQLLSDFVSTKEEK